MSHHIGRDGIATDRIDAYVVIAPAGGAGVLGIYKNSRLLPGVRTVYEVATGDPCRVEIREIDWRPDAMPGKLAELVKPEPELEAKPEAKAEPEAPAPKPAPEPSPEPAPEPEAKTPEPAEA